MADSALRCTRCGADNPPAARFCSACGNGLGGQCARCGAEFQGGQRFCSTCGQDLAPGAPSPPHATPRAAAPPDDGERRQATVMFSDLAGYTALNEALDPEDVEAVMTRI